MKYAKAVTGAVLIFASIVFDPNNWNLVSTGLAMLMFIIGMVLLFTEMWQSGVASGSEY